MIEIKQSTDTFSGRDHCNIAENTEEKNNQSNQRRTLSVLQFQTPCIPLFKWIDSNLCFISTSSYLNEIHSTSSFAFVSFQFTRNLNETPLQFLDDVFSSLYFSVEEKKIENNTSCNFIIIIVQICLLPLSYSMDVLIWRCDFHSSIDLQLRHIHTHFLSASALALVIYHRYPTVISKLLQ